MIGHLLECDKAARCPSLTLLPWKPKQTTTKPVVKAAVSGLTTGHRLLPSLVEHLSFLAPRPPHPEPSSREPRLGSFPASCLSGFERNVAFPRTRRKVGGSTEAPEPYSRSRDPELVFLHSILPCQEFCPACPVREAASPGSNPP